MQRRSVAITFIAQLFILSLSLAPQCTGQQYDYYVTEKSKKLVDMRQFLVEQDGGDTTSRRGTTVNMQDTTAPRELPLAIPTEPAPAKAPATRSQTTQNRAVNRSQGEGGFQYRSLNSGISPGIMSRATTRNNFNLQFASSSVASIPPTSTLQTVTWRSPNFAHRPLYFQETNLERYGNRTGKWQTVRSGAHFFKTVALLPYNVAANPPKTCEYAMGYYRPGNCNPAHRDNYCMDRRRGAAAQILSLATLLSVL